MSQSPYKFQGLLRNENGKQPTEIYIYINLNTASYENDFQQK